MKSATLRGAIGIAMLSASLSALALPTGAAVESALGRGDYASAESMLQQVVAAKPANAKAWLMLAEAEAKLGHRPQASDALAKASSLTPSPRSVDAEAYDAASNYLKASDAAPGPAALPSQKQVEDAIRAQNWTQAESMLGQVVAAKPNNAKAWYFLSETEEKLGKFSHARQDLSKAEALDPGLKFASPGAVPQMEQRLAREEAGTSRAPAPSYQRQQPQPIYAARPATTSSSYGTPVSAPVDQKPASHAWIFVLLGLIVLGAGAYWFFSKRAKDKELEESEHARKGLLARANSLQERATALAKTARFEGQESSAFGVAASGALSRANSALSRLKVSGSGHDSAGLDSLESDIEALENQAARKAWDEKASAPAAPAPAPSSFSANAPAQAPGSVYQGSGLAGYPAAGYPAPGYVQPIPQQNTVIIDNGNSGTGLLETMIVADALRDSHRERDYERDRDYDRQRQRDYDRQQQTYAPAPAPAEPPAAFDMGGSDGGWDSGNSPSQDSSSSSSSDWDSGSSSSSDDSGSSSSSDDSSW